MPSCSTIFSPVHCSITVSNLSQMLMKRSCEASCSSIQSPIHLCGTPFSMQHCSGKECTTFIIYGVFFCYLKIWLFYVFAFNSPGQSLSMHGSDILASPWHGAPPYSSSCSLNLCFSLRPSPHVTEQSPCFQSLHLQSTEKYFE